MPIVAVLIVVAAFLVTGASSASAMTYGVNWPANYSPSELEAVQRSGSNVYRLPFDMANYDGDWDFYNALFQSAWEHNVNIQPYLVRSSATGNRFLIEGDAQWSTWYTATRKAVEQFGVNGSFWNGKSNPKPVNAWEVWNEENLPENNPQLTEAQCKNAGQKIFKKADGSFNNCVQPGNYGAFLVYTAAAIQQGSTNKTSHGTEVLYGGLWMPAGGEYYGSFMQEAAKIPGVTTSYTGVAIHPYAFYGKVAEMGEEIKSVRYVLDHYISFGGTKPLWVTEVGWPLSGTQYPTVTPEQQANLLTESLNWMFGHAAENNIVEAIWYNLKDVGGSNWDSHNGLIDQEGLTRPAWKAFKKITGAGDDPPTTTTVESATALNGNPGWASVRGHVTATEGTVNGRFVNINLKKKEGASYVYKATVHVNVVNGFYELNQWEGVGPGEWVAKVVFPGQVPFDESSSNEATEGKFLVKDGYRIVNQTSEKCLDIKEGNRDNLATLQQWDCSDPTTHQNQVFTLVPTSSGSGYYQLKSRQSGRCLDVYNASTADGASVMQYTCGGQANQAWQLRPSGERFELVAKHSGKCLDVPGGTKALGTALQQWTCNGSGQQKWSFQSVDAGPIPTETGLTVPEGERLNGEYGYVSVQGYVRTGAYPAGALAVLVKYEKWNGSSWELRSTTEPTLNGEGFYQWRYLGVGPGDWRAKTYYGGSGQLAGSASPNYVNFHIGSGYRFVFRSEKCLTLNENKNVNGQAMIQWECLAPNPGYGQTFTMVPQENGARFELKINSTGKCVDVTGASTADGAWIQQWDCNGSDQQRWQPIPIAGQWPFNAWMAKNSGKCMDVTGVSKENGVRIQQWSCHWGSNQQWYYSGVG